MTVAFHLALLKRNQVHVRAAWKIIMSGFCTRSPYAGDDDVNDDDVNDDVYDAEDSPWDSQKSYLVACAAVSALVGVILTALLYCSDPDHVDRWVMLHVAFFGFRFFDLFTDWGVFWALMTDRFRFDDGAQLSWLDYLIGGDNLNCGLPVMKIVVLTSSICGTLLFIPDIFVYARKLRLAQKLGDRFTCYNPDRNTSIIIMCLSLLLESMPQMYCTILINMEQWGRTGAYFDKWYPDDDRVRRRSAHPNPGH